VAEPRVIERNGVRLALYIPAAGWKEGLTFLSPAEDYVQCGVWRYDSGMELQPHIHNELKREASRTQEVVFVRSGSVLAHIYDEAGDLVEKVTLKPSDTLVLLRGGHGYKILEDGTSVLEVKNGPFAGAEADRRRIQWKE